MNHALILEDQPEARTWMAEKLLQAYPSIEVKQACSLDQAFKHCKKITFDLALIDINLPDGTGNELILNLSQTSPQTISIVVTIYDDEHHIFPALQAGAKGYLLKDMPAEKFIERLQGITSGEPALSSEITLKLVRYFSTINPEPGSLLTAREKEVLTLIAKGYTQPEASQLLDLSPHTINGYIKTIYRKLSINSRAEATLEAARLGLVRP
ncbi:Response regulator transcription factor [uncultured Thiomicrorhabdus sp.]